MEQTGMLDQWKQQKKCRTKGMDADGLSPVSVTEVSGVSTRVSGRRSGAAMVNGGVVQWSEVRRWVRPKYGSQHAKCQTKTDLFSVATKRTPTRHNTNTTTRHTRSQTARQQHGTQ